MKKTILGGIVLAAATALSSGTALAASLTQVLETKRYAIDPTLAFPWDRRD